MISFVLYFGGIHRLAVYAKMTCQERNYQETCERVPDADSRLDVLQDSRVATPTREH
jgi:hypothetical protein